jgi:TnpA family transposase
MGRDLNKGEAFHELSRFLCFGKEGALWGREFGDQLHTFSLPVGITTAFGCRAPTY